MISQWQRRQLPTRRLWETRDIETGNARLSATIGFYPEGIPAELFMGGAKDGSGLAAILDDASVVISIALQHGIPARALAKSISRAPDGLGRVTVIRTLPSTGPRLLSPSFRPSPA